MNKVSIFSSDSMAILQLTKQECDQREMFHEYIDWIYSTILFLFNHHTF